MSAQYPQFVEKVRDIVGLYLNPPERCGRAVRRREVPDPGADRTAPILPADPGHVAADAVEIDAMSRTGVPGLFAAGDLNCQMPSVANAAAAGASAAAAIVHGLMG